MKEKARCMVKFSWQIAPVEFKKHACAGSWTINLKIQSSFSYAESYLATVKTLLMAFWSFGSLGLHCSTLWHNYDRTLIWLSFRLNEVLFRNFRNMLKFSLEQVDMLSYDIMLVSMQNKIFIVIFLSWWEKKSYYSTVCQVFMTYWDFVGNALSWAKL